MSVEDEEERESVNNGHRINAWTKRQIKTITRNLLFPFSSILYLPATFCSILQLPVSYVIGIPFPVGTRNVL